MSLTINSYSGGTISGSGTFADPYSIEMNYYSFSASFSYSENGTIFYEFSGEGSPYYDNSVEPPVYHGGYALFVQNLNYVWNDDLPFTGFPSGLSNSDNFSVDITNVNPVVFDISAYPESGTYVWDNTTVSLSVWFVSDVQIPTALIVDVQPAGVVSGDPFTTQPTIKIVDQDGNLIPTATDDVDVSINVVTGSGSLTGTTTITAVDGYATFTDLVVTGYGSFYLTFSSGTLTSVNSDTLFFTPDAGNPNPPIPVKPKRSYIPSSVPTSGDMETNEFAINVADKKGYVRDSNGIVHQVFDGNASGSGTVTSVGLSSTNSTLTISNSPVTTSGTIKIDLSKTSVSAKAYTNADITVDAYGRITAASDGAVGVTSIIAGTGVSVDTATGDVTVTNSLPDQTVSLTNGTAISVTGTYPDFTITNDAPDQIVTLTDGTAISVTGTYPDFTITNSLPDQTVTLTEGTDITITGTYPDFTIGYSGVASGVTSIIAGTGISVDVTTGDVTVTNSLPDQTVTLTNGTAISVTGTYPDFTITNDSPDQTVSLTNGTAISITGTYPDFTITNDAPDQIVSITSGTGINATGIYPDFTIDSTITQYTDSDARLALSAGTGISYDNATGIITNSEPDQIVALTGGTDISVTGTYPDFTIDFDGNTSYLPLSGGTMTGSITSFGTTHDTEVSGDFFGVQLSADHTQGTMINFDGLDTYSGSSHMKVIPTGLTFPDATTQTTAYTGGAGVSSIIAGTGISVDAATGDVTITNEAPDQTVSLTDGTGISVTGTYPDFTIATTITQYTNSDARLSLSAGTGISYDNATGIITNSAPDQTVSLTEGTDITITGTYPDFTIAYSGSSGGVTSITAGTGISVDVTTGAVTVTNSEPDQTVTLTAGTSISITGTYPDFTIGYTGSNLSEAENLIAEVYNNSGATLTKGTIVYINGGHGNLPTVAKALATSDATSAQTFGIVRTNITNNNNGYLIIVGNLIDLDTSDYAEGTQLYLSGTTAGTWTSTKPSAPTHLVYVGIVVRSHPTQGVVTVKIQNGYELDEIHDVSITSVANNNILQYNSSTKLWTNVAGTTKNISEDTNLYYTDTRARSSVSSTATGLTYTSGTGVFSLTSGYSIPSTSSQSNWDTAYTNRITSLTVTGSSGASTLVSNVLNIPTYTLLGLGGQASSASLTSLAGLTYVSASFIKMTASNTFSLDTSTYLTANQTITLSGDVSGSGSTSITTTLATVPITKGGTGQTTANAAINALLPSQTSNSGKYLTTDGTNSSWGTVSSGTTIPSASMQMFAGAITQTVSAGTVTTTAPTGWLLCNGNAVSRSTYSALWTALGQTASPYGQGDGSTTFNLPDMRSRVGVGVGQGTGLTNRTLGGTVGTENETLLSSQIPAHSHPNTVSGGNTSSAGSHTHTLSKEVLTYVGSGGSRYDPYPGTVWTGSPAAGLTLTTQPDHQHTFTPSITNNNNTGGGGSHNNMQPSIGLNFIIKI